MSFLLVNRQGAMVRDPSMAAVDPVLAELDGPPDDEHPDVALSHESGWTLSAFASGLVVSENVEADDPPRRLTEVRREQVRELWLALAVGDFEAIEQQPWQPAGGA